MAERRMFAKAVVGSDRFRELAPASQALYLQLSMAADDEGFLRNAKSTARAIGAGVKELEELVRARLLLRFDSGVMLLRHWLVSNAIRADRRRGTACIAEREMVTLNRNGVYCLRTEADVCPAVSVPHEEAARPSEAAGQSADSGPCSAGASFPSADKRRPPSPASAFSTPHMVDSWQPNDSQMPKADSQMPKADNQMPKADSQMPKADSQFPSQVRLGKVRLGKVRLGKVRSGEIRSGKKEREGRRWASPLPLSVLFFPTWVNGDGAACRRQGLRAPPG